MFTHLFNCHNEWVLILGAVGSLPFIGIFAKTKLRKLKDLIQDRLHNYTREPHVH